MTLPLPLIPVTLILHKEKRIAKCLEVHERVHCRQIDERGFLGAVRMAIGERIRYHGWKFWRSEWQFGKRCPHEIEGYDAQRKCLEG